MYSNPFWFSCHRSKPHQLLHKHIHTNIGVGQYFILCNTQFYQIRIYDQLKAKYTQAHSHKNGDTKTIYMRCISLYSDKLFQLVWLLLRRTWNCNKIERPACFWLHNAFFVHWCFLIHKIWFRKFRKVFHNDIFRNFRILPPL